ncbi:protein TOM THREE HOMOLOG 1-like isoform X1 [Phragmites australis]|uniref:protein TOM THREE HOMOLOG 1-like isoform X1 n=1 Tax=Phragmites australis TaxID=29695 RepID=UPI002D78AD50|nr:protein TOM THREE HOMOLOG 1-like isoform X1 [Phragmites australis]
MVRYGPFRVAAGDGGGCPPLPIVASEAVLAVVDGAIATAAFVQLTRIHRHNQQQGWTRQKIFHFMIGLSNIVFLLYFLSTIIATCQRWICWVHGCGFVLMASPQILLLASFLLLLSFWVDLCHQTNDEDEEDVRSHHEALLDRTKTKPGIRPVTIRRRCFPGMQLGSRQKFVILVLVLSFVVMFAFAILIWVGRGENPIDSSLLKRVYLDVFSVVVLVLGGALACYGALLFSKMSKVRSETVSTEKWKVASLAVVSLICFSSSAILALVTNVPVLLYWYSTDADIVNNAVILFVYYFIGSSVPSGFVLWIMRDMPHRHAVERPTESRVVTLFRERPSNVQDPQWRTAVTSSNKVLQALKSSPI